MRMQTRSCQYEPTNETLQSAEKGAVKRSPYILRKRQVHNRFGTSPLNQTFSEKDDLDESLAVLEINSEKDIFTQDALADQRWREAMELELGAMKENHVWDLTDLPVGKKPIKCRWVYKIKHDTDGKVERYKARLVAKGFSQKFAIDYEETFSPVVKHETVRMLMAIAAQKGLQIHHMDVVSGFLYGDLN